MSLFNVVIAPHIHGRVSILDLVGLTAFTLMILLIYILIATACWCIKRPKYDSFKEYVFNEFFGAIFFIFICFLAMTVLGVAFCAFKYWLFGTA